jgi:hypothetical protein
MSKLSQGSTHLPPPPPAHGGARPSAPLPAVPPVYRAQLGPPLAQAKRANGLPTLLTVFRPELEAVPQDRKLPAGAPARIVPLPVSRPQALVKALQAKASHTGPLIRPSHSPFPAAAIQRAAAAAPLPQLLGGVYPWPTANTNARDRHHLLNAYNAGHIPAAYVVYYVHRYQYQGYGNVGAGDAGLASTIVRATNPATGRNYEIHLHDSGRTRSRFQRL